jgi:hypothetical protein
MNKTLLNFLVYPICHFSKITNIKKIKYTKAASKLQGKVLIDATVCNLIHPIYLKTINIKYLIPLYFIYIVIIKNIISTVNIDVKNHNGILYIIKFLLDVSISLIH